jgi:spore germination cell wall hydrolase CwlJ-like protein
MKMDKLILVIGILILLLAVSVKEPAKAEAKVLQPIENFDAKDQHCLAVMIYGEARGENFYGKSAVAWTAVNRLDRMPYNGICHVVLSGHYHAFRNNDFRVAATTGKAPSKLNAMAWKESTKVAKLVYEDTIPDPTKGATHFINPKKLKYKPKWTRKLKRTVVIDNHEFYG